MRLAAALLAGLLLGAALVSGARADAVVVTRAMKATTIAQFHVEEGRMRCELEIGVADLLAFADALPEELRGRLGLEPEPLAERVPRFFLEGLVVRSDGGEPLPGRIEGAYGRPRVVRDEITGAPLPAPTEEVETVLVLDLAWELPGRPATLTLARGEAISAAMPDLGFALYHDRVQVNDFRYLGTDVTVHLDWDDPFYSRFENRNLRRQFYAPISAFLYVEPFEVRKEVVIRPRDLQDWVDLGLEGKDTIAAEDWGALLAAVVDFLQPRAPVIIDGRAVEPVLARIHFLERSLRTTSVVDPPRDLPLDSATLGVIFRYAIPELPQEVTMEWDLFVDRLPSVPASAVDEAGGLPTYLTPADPVLVWTNFLVNPTVPALVDVAPPPGPPTIALPLASLACLALIVLLAWRAPNGRLDRGRQLAALALLAVAFVAWPRFRVHAASPLGGGATLAPEEASEVVGALLENVYRSFDFREEEAIYDALARTTAGELLTDVYLQTRRALELENQGGAQARVQEVELVAAEAQPLDGDDEGVGFAARCTWNVTGSVGHWGHLHQRRNQYEADVTVRVLEEGWRITGLELRNEVRL